MHKPTLILAALTALVTFTGCSCGGDPCRTGGKGALVINVTGLPEGVAGKVTATGSSEQTVTETRTLSDVASGSYTVTADKAVQADPRIRTAFAPTV